MLPKSKLNSIDVLIFTALIDLVLVFTHNKFVLINNVWKEYNDSEEKSKNSKNKEVCLMQWKKY